ncbi:hypothetical protein [Litorivicinus lipolyticus]|nr:hypothetical protein [Litorivicinus lipolyticus]
MKVMLSAFIAAFVIAYGATVVLGELGWSSAEQTSSATSVRLD